MSWKDILKIDIHEARKLGHKYAPEDMKAGNKEIEVDEQLYLDAKKKVLEFIPKYIEKYHHVDESDITRRHDSKPYIYKKLAELEKETDPVRLYHSIMNITGNLNAKAHGDKKELGAFHNSLNLVKPPKVPKSKTTSLIDRAKQANKDDPRMGSGRDSERKSAGPVSSKTSGVHRVSYSERDEDGKGK